MRRIGHGDTALSGQLGFGEGTDTLPENWIIEWERFLELNGSRPQMARTIDAQLTDSLREVATPFADRTPLWFYVLAEAGDPNGSNGRHLGKLGSRIECDAFWQFIRVSHDSVLDPDSEADVDRFTLSDLVTLAFRDEGGAAAGA